MIRTVTPKGSSAEVLQIDRMGRIRHILALSVAACITPCAWAEDNVAIILNGTTTNFGGSLTIGNTGTNNSLQILNGGSATNTSATVGASTTANNNFVL